MLRLGALVCNAGTPEDALDAMTAGVDVIDGSYAVRATAAGAALLLRECDRGPAGAHAPIQAEQTHSVLSQPEPTSRHVSPDHGMLHRRRGAAEAAGHQGVSREAAQGRNEDHASLSPSGGSDVPLKQEAMQPGSAVAASPAGLGEAAGRPTPASSSSSRGRAHSSRASEGASALERSQQAGAGAAREAQEWGADDTTMSMHSDRFRRDTRPLSPGCSCHTCRRHTRAYIHHLLNANEMLAQVCCDFPQNSSLVAVGEFYLIKLHAHASLEPSLRGV